MTEKLIVSVGEVVWDQFPDGAVLGGAPLNVAYHLQARGLPVLGVSRIGRDDLGAQTMARIGELGLRIDGLQQDDSQPTGQVLVTVDEHNEPHFDIAQPAAWDFIEHEALLKVVAQRPFHLVFGTLGQRHGVSRATIQALWSQAQSSFYDVNLRPPFTTEELVEASLLVADVVKVNEDELQQVNQWFVGQQGGDVDKARALLTAFNISLLAVTRGGDGAMLVTKDEVAEHPGFTVQVADTVGSGDAFFSKVIDGFLKGEKLDGIVEDANRIGSYVASKAGATPEYGE